MISRLWSGLSLLLWVVAVLVLCVPFLLLVALLVMWDKLRGRPLSWLLLPLILSGCMYSSVPTPDGRRARTVRLFPWTTIESMRMEWTYGASNVVVDLNGYTGKVDGESIDQTGGAIGTAAGTAGKTLLP